MEQNPIAGRKPLIIAEKPSAARAVADGLGGFTRRQGYMESPDYLLSWALGHLVELCEPEEYDPAYKRWSLSQLPILPDVFRTKVAEKTRSQFRVLQQLVRRASCLINACDAGREGELIFRYIVEQLGAEGLPAYRLWVSSLTPEAIRQGFRDLRPLSEYDRLYASAACRARGDWLVGMNATRAFTCRFGELFPVGRVQTPTLAMLVRREQEIRAFRPEPYWEVVARFRVPAGGPGEGPAEYAGKWFGPEGDRLPTAAAAAGVAERVRTLGTGEVRDRQEREVVERPPQLYDLTSLQREANRRYGLTAAATLAAAQELYERRLITYPRTDSRYLTRDVARSLPRVLAALDKLPAYHGLVAAAEPQRIWNGRVVNEARVTDHHAIIPTGEPVPALEGAPAKVFDLIARRLLAQLYPEARFLDVELITAAGTDTFRSRGRQVLAEGWRAVDPPAAQAEANRGRRRRAAAPAAGAPADAGAGTGEGDGAGEPAGPPLPPVQAGTPVAVAEVAEERKETQPPRRYTEGMLLAAMESAGKELEDEALREAMKDRGLGTPATRAAIIERLREVGYITRRGKVLVPTAKGERLVALAEAVGAEVLLSPELTGEWEKRIADIQKGTDDPDRLLADMRELAVQVVNLVKAAGAAPGLAAADREAAAAGEALPVPAAEGVRAGSCPRCGEPVTLTGRDWRCAGPDCGLRIPAWLCGKRIGLDLAGILLREGRTPLIQGFRSPRTGKEFDAYLVLQETGVGFEFPARRPGRRTGSRTERQAGAADHPSRGMGGTGAGRGGRSRAGGDGAGAGPT